ncbi:hypothetical protein [Arthrobacter sp. CAN_C5]|uniref:hypothetical protein n=1 Tax=Arthrobacter sp. CAN_C5 TaxID=2760706 RepID=UPI001AE563B7|nr:hypothetical protein [Arthrobacter sp. CAN_C5]MBP2217757.1 hypothetical protein [Arthrobacter sp. CAN_C5]
MTTQNWSEDPLTAAPSGERVRPDSPAGNTPVGESNGSAGVKDQAKDQAKKVGRDGLNAAQGVAQTATTEAKNVAAEASTQAKNLLGELGSDLKDQAGASQQKAAEGLRSISDELVSMADNGDHNGPANSLVRQAAQRSGDVAGWLEGRDPGSLLDEVKDFARRRPGTFLMVAAGAGLLAGRLTRGLAGAGSDSSSTTPANPAPEYPPTVPSQPAAGTGPAFAPATPATETTPMMDNGLTSADDARQISNDPLADPLAAEPVIVPGTRTQNERLDRDLR